MYEFDYNFYNNVKSNLQNAYNNAMPSDQERDTAASRIRSRLAAQQKGNEQQLGDYYTSRGRLNSGGYSGNLMSSRASAGSALASGLADNESNYLKARQQGAQIQGDIANSQAQLGLGYGQLGNQRYSAETDRTKVENDYQLGNRGLDHNWLLGNRQIDRDLYLGNRGLDIESAFNEGRLGVERDTFGESVNRRKAETLIEGLKTFGQYGNASQQQNYSRFAEALRQLFQQAGINIEAPPVPPPPSSSAGKPEPG